MLDFFSSFNGIVTMSVATIVFIFAFFGYLIWKFMKLSAQKPAPNQKVW